MGACFVLCISDLANYPYPLSMRLEINKFIVDGISLLQINKITIILMPAYFRKNNKYAIWLYKTEQIVCQSTIPYGDRR